MVSPWIPRQFGEQYLLFRGGFLHWWRESRPSPRAQAARLRPWSPARRNPEDPSSYRDEGVLQVSKGNGTITPVGVVNAAKTPENITAQSPEEARRKRRLSAM